MCNTRHMPVQTAHKYRHMIVYVIYKYYKWEIQMICLIRTKNDHTLFCVYNITLKFDNDIRICQQMSVLYYARLEDTAIYAHGKHNKWRTLLLIRTAKYQVNLQHFNYAAKITVYQWTSPVAMSGLSTIRLYLVCGCATTVAWSVHPPKLWGSTLIETKTYKFRGKIECLATSEHNPILT